MLNALISLSSDPKFSDSFEFISSELEPYTSCLYYIPQLKEEACEVMISLEEVKGEYFDHFIIKSIKVNGTEVFNPEEASSSFPYRWNELTNRLKQYMAIPSDKIEFKKNIDTEELKTIELPYPLRLSVPQ